MIKFGIGRKEDEYKILPHTYLYFYKESIGFWLYRNKFVTFIYLWFIVIIIEHYPKGKVKGINK